MFFLIPIGSEEGVRKWPVLTLTLIGLNVFIWIITSLVMARQVAQIQDIDQQMREIEYRYIYRLMETDPQRVMIDDYEVVRERFRNDEIILPDDPNYEKWHLLDNELNRKLGSTVFETYGFTPARFNFFKMITSLFVHANFFHLLFNMLFLWMVGCNIEDDWSWKIFGGLYLVSGIAACGLHGLMYPASTMPLIGASGAIAGIMGAFMIRHFKTKISFAYFIWFFWRPYFGRFRIFAGIALPIWFLEQILSASWSSEAGVAYYAHIGGFAFGAVVGACFKYFGIEKKYIAPMVEETFEKLKLSPLMKDGYKRLEAGDTDAAQDLFNQALESEPDNFDARLVLARISQEQKLAGKAAVFYNDALQIAMRIADFQAVLSIRDEVNEAELTGHLSEQNLYMLASLLESRARYRDAAALYEQILLKYPQSRVRAKTMQKACHLYRTKLNDEKAALTIQSALQQEFPDQAVQAVKKEYKGRT